jgi:Uncharacterised nucleotidyltransferase
MNRRKALAQLTGCLRGELPAAPDWAAILMLANRALVTAQLYEALARSGAAPSLPDDVHGFLREVSERNRERNRRLSHQLTEALQALNDAGIEPILLKGAAVWASSGRGLTFNRILSDLDLLVKPVEVERALDALAKAGFPCVARHSWRESHAVATLGRPTDVGHIDLHQRPPGPLGIADIRDVDSFCTQISWFGARARVPAPALQILYLVLHDQFHDGDYWRGGFDLRHLIDIAELSRAPQPVDWLMLDALCKTSLVRNVLRTQLLAVEQFLGAAVPPDFINGRWVRFQHQRHMWQFAYPGISAPLALVGMATEWTNLLAHRALNEIHRREALGPKTVAAGTMLARAASKVSRRATRLRRFFSPRVGKL